MFVFRAWLYLNMASGILLVLYCLQVLNLLLSAMSHVSLHYSSLTTKDLTVRLGTWFSMAFLIVSVIFYTNLPGHLFFIMFSQFDPPSSSDRSSQYVLWYNHIVYGGTCSITGEKFREVLSR